MGGRDMSCDMPISKSAEIAGMLSNTFYNAYLAISSGIYSGEYVQGLGSLPVEIEYVEEAIADAKKQIEELLGEKDA